MPAYPNYSTRRSSATYTPPSYGGETVLAEVIDRLNEQLDLRAERKQAEEEQARELSKIGTNVRMAGAAASDAVDRSIEAERESARKQQVIAELSKRYAAGDRSAGASLIMAGVPSTAVKMLEPEEPEPEKPSEADTAYQRRIGTLRAEKEMNAGAFKPAAPKRAEAPAGPMSMTEAQRQARAAVSAHLGGAFDYRGSNASPVAAVVQAIVMDPGFASMTQDRNFVSALKAEAARAVRDEEAKRNRTTGKGRAGTGDIFGAAEAYVKSTPPR